MEGWPDDAKRTMTKVAKIIGDAVNAAPCPSCAAPRAEVDAKDTRIRELEDAAQTWKNAWNAACNDIGPLRARVAVLEKALLFYGNEDNWENDVVDIGVGNLAVPHSSEAARDEGSIARAALKEG